MSAFMVHPQGCISRGKDPLKKVPAWQGVGLEADTPGSSQARWSMLGKNGGEYPCLQWGHMESMVWIWSLERGWIHKLTTSRWVFRTKQGAVICISGVQLVLNMNKSCFLLTTMWGLLLDQTWVGILEQAYTIPFMVGAEEEAWEEEPQVLVLVWL